MTSTLVIQNSNKDLIAALKGVIKLHPQSKVSIKNNNDDFYSEANIKHLEEMKRLADEGKLKFTEHELIRV